MITNMKGWTFLTGDVNWEDYGGTWARKGADDIWWVLRFDNKAEWGDGASGYYCEVFRIDMEEVPPEALQSAIDCCAWTHDDIRRDCNGDADSMELMYLEALRSYGLGAPMGSFDGNRAMSVRAQARRLAEELGVDDAKCGKLLRRKINQIGSTAADLGRGDSLAGLRRTAKKVIEEGKMPSVEDSIMLKMYAASGGNTLGGKQEIELAVAGETVKALKGEKDG